MVISIELHHSTSVLLSIGLMMSRSTSWPRLSLMVLFQWCGMGFGECLAYVTGCGCRCMWVGVVAITRKGADWLKALDENFSSMYCFNFGIFSLVGANGIAEGLVGGGVLFIGSDLFDVVLFDSTADTA